jgi:ABC-2 type transport system permease protein
MEITVITDILTILWKESKEIFAMTTGSGRGGAIRLLIIIGVFGIMMPLQSGLEWLTTPITVMVFGWIPFLLVGGVVSDSFAGERERHTLETLLASRLPDEAILFGKIAACVVYGWGLAMVSLMLGLITINFALGEVLSGGSILIFPADIGLGTLLISFLIALFAAALGVLISLRAATARQAAQTFSLGFLLFFLPLLIMPALPAPPSAIQAALETAIYGENIWPIILAAVLFLLMLDAVLLGLGMARFKRSKLLLD